MFALFNQFSSSKAFILKAQRIKNQTKGHLPAQCNLVSARNGIKGILQDVDMNDFNKVIYFNFI